jgi:hypothetical protein
MILILEVPVRISEFQWTERKKKLERGGEAIHAPSFFVIQKEDNPMIHQIQVELHNLVDVRSGEVSSLPLLAKRGVCPGDFLCFECNAASFPKKMKRWLYVQVTKTELTKTIRHGVESQCMIRAHFEIVSCLSDVVLR